MVYRPNVDTQRCFVLLPLRSPFLGYFDQIVKPAALEAGLVAVKADDIYGTRAVIRDIWELIWTARAVIAIVTGQNPNVNYELGMCHALGIPTILVTEHAEDVPFDYRHRRYIRYVPKEAGWERKLFEDIRNTLKSILSSPSAEDELLWPYDTFDWTAQRKTGRIVPAEDSRASVVRGVLLVRHSLATAYGPQGTQVAVNVPPNNRTIPYRRGYTIAQGTESDEPLEKQGIEQMRRLAGEIFNVAGDGTKTGVLLSSGLIERGHEAIVRGCVRKSLLAGMQRAVEAAAAHIMTCANSVTAVEAQAVTYTAAGSDKETTAFVLEALKKVGKDGVIEIVDGPGQDTELEIQEGMQFDSGFLSPSFVTDSERQECVLEDCYILLHEGQIGSMFDLLPLLEQVARAGKPLLVIASDLTEEPLATLIVNKQKGTLVCAAVKAPGQADRRRATLEDIAVLTGGRALLREVLRSIRDANLSDLGRAQKVIVTRGDTTIIGGMGRPDEIATRVQSLRRQVDSGASLYDIAKLRERLAKLGGAIAIIRPGGLTEVDRIDCRYKLESALHSCYSAMENGYAIGGGLPYIKARVPVERLVPSNESERLGIAAVSYCLEQPLRQLVENSRVYDRQKILNEILLSDSDRVGFNAETETIEDLVAAGVLDSAKTLKDALLLAFAHAKGILTTGAWDTGQERGSDLGTETH